MTFSCEAKETVNITENTISYSIHFLQDGSSQWEEDIGTKKLTRNFLSRSDVGSYKCVVVPKGDIKTEASIILTYSGGAYKTDKPCIDLDKTTALPTTTQDPGPPKPTGVQIGVSVLMMLLVVVVIVWTVHRFKQGKLVNKRTLWVVDELNYDRPKDRA